MALGKIFIFVIGQILNKIIKPCGHTVWEERKIALTFLETFLLVAEKILNVGDKFSILLWIDEWRR